MTLLLRSVRTTSRHCPFIQPVFSLVPTIRKPQAFCRARLATFSGKVPACSVQIPTLSDSSITAFSKALPTPCPLADDLTYRLTSATPLYAHLSETELSATQPTILPSDLATILQSRRGL